MIRPLVPALLILALAACDRGQDPAAITVTGDNGATLASVGRDGEVKVDVPGFSGKLDLPGLKIDTADFDLNGVRLYPGSTISGVNVSSDAGIEGGGVRVRFASPADPDTVRRWFAERLAKAGFTLRNDGARLVGTTDEGKPFRLETRGAGAGKAEGTIVIGG